MYAHRGAYELTASEQQEYGLNEVEVLFDEYRNGVVINHPDNGLLAGDRIRSRDNPYFKTSEPASTSNRPLVFSLTDDHNAELAVQLAETKRRGEDHRLQTMLGQLAVVASGLPQLESESTSGRAQTYRAALNSIRRKEDRARDPNKKRAVELVDEAMAIFSDRGLNVTDELSEKVHLAAVNLSWRKSKITGQGRRNKEREVNLQRELSADKIVKQNLKFLAQEADYSSIMEAPELYLSYARQRMTKPGSLTVNNAWHHRHAEDSWRGVIQAQDGWEPLYGALMEPMSKLKNITLREAKPEQVLSEFAPTLLALEDLLDLSMIGGDYDVLTNSLRTVLYDVEQHLIDGEIAKAKRAAKEYRFLLRYRTLNRQITPAEWYVVLPGIEHTIDAAALLSKEEIADPFHGLEAGQQRDA